MSTTPRLKPVLQNQNLILKQLTVLLNEWSIKVALPRISTGFREAKISLPRGVRFFLEPQGPPLKASNRERPRPFRQLIKGQSIADHNDPSSGEILREAGQDIIQGDSCRWIHQSRSRAGFDGVAPNDPFPMGNPRFFGDPLQEGPQVLQGGGSFTEGHRGCRIDENMNRFVCFLSVFANPSLTQPLPDMEIEVLEIFSTLPATVALEIFSFSRSAGSSATRPLMALTLAPAQTGEQRFGEIRSRTSHH